MKRSVVLLIVVGAVGVVDASLTIVAPAEMCIAESASVGIEVVGEKALLSGAIAFQGGLKVDAGLATIVDVPGISNKPFIEDVTGNADMQAFLADLGVPGAETVLYYEVMHAGFPALDISDGMLIDGITITDGGPGLTSITLVDVTMGRILDRAEVSYVGGACIPEPGTIALIGLGGLLVLRHKRR